MGMTISSGGTSYVQQMSQQNQRHEKINSQLFENRQSARSNVAQAIQDNSVKLAQTTASIKEEALKVGSLVNTFA